MRERERSAEWLRAAIEVLELWGSSHYDSIQDALLNYRQLLAAAEAREARPLPEVLEVARKALELASGTLDHRGINYKKCYDWCPACAATSALATIAAYRDGTAEAMRLLEEIQAEAASDEHEGQEYEDERNVCNADECQRCAIWHRADHAIAALRGGK